MQLDELRAVIPLTVSASTNEKRMPGPGRAAPLQLPIGIVGGGLGGVALARALQRRRIPYVVFEKDACFEERSQVFLSSHPVLLQNLRGRSLHMCCLPPVLPALHLFCLLRTFLKKARRAMLLQCSKVPPPSKTSEYC